MKKTAKHGSLPPRQNLRAHLLQSRKSQDSDKKIKLLERKLGKLNILYTKRVVKKPDYFQFDKDEEDDHQHFKKSSRRKKKIRKGKATSNRSPYSRGQRSQRKILENETQTSFLLK